MPRRGSRGLGTRLLWRRLTSAPGPAITVVVATLLTVLFVTAVPRVLELVSQADLDDAVAGAEPEERNLWAVTQARFATGSGEPLSLVNQRGVDLMDEVFPPKIQAIVGEVRAVAETPQFRVGTFPDDQPGPFPTSLRFRLQDGIDDEMTLVDGSMPSRHAPMQILLGNGCPDDRLDVATFVEDPEIDCVAGEVPVFEIAITEETSADMGLGVGDRAFLHPDPQDRLWFAHGIPNEPPTFVLEVSGIIDLSDPEREIWFADTSLHRPRIVENPDFRLIFAQGWMTPEVYADVLTALPNADMRYTWRYLVDPDRLDAARAADLLVDLGRITPPLDEDVFTSLPALLTRYLEQRALTVNLLSIAIISLLVVAAGAVLALGRMMAERHAPGTVLTMDRGASRGQVALGATLTGLALIAPATVLAWAVTDLVFPGTDGLVPSRGAALFAAAGTIATLISGLPAARASLEPGRGGAGPGKEPGARRVVAEVFVMVAAVGAVILLRRRGHAEASSDAPIDVDLLLAITPALVGLAAGIIAIRVMPSIMRLLSWLGARRTTVVGFVGYRRLMSMPASARAPILVILVAVTVAVFTSVVRTSIETGQSEHMWQLTGADLRLEHRSPGAALPGAVDPVDLAAGGPWAEAALFPDTRIIADASYPLSLLLAIDSSAYQEVLEGTPFDPELVSGLAGGEGPIPALVSSRLGVVPPAVGTELSLEMGEIDPEVVVAGVIDRFPSVPPDEPFVVVALDRLREARGELQVPATTLFLRADEPEAMRIAETVSPPVRAVSRYQIGATLTADPLARLADGTLAGVFYLSSAFALVAAVSLFSATAGRRRHDLGLLRILGLTRDQSAGVTALELGPPVLTATLIGGVTGAMVALLLEPALDIDSFTGGLLPAEIFVDWRPLIVVTALILTVVAGAVAIFVVVSRSEDEGTLLRVGED